MSSPPTTEADRDELPSVLFISEGDARVLFGFDTPVDTTAATTTAATSKMDDIIHKQRREKSPIAQRQRRERGGEEPTLADEMKEAEEERRLNEESELCVPMNLTNLCGHVCENETASIIVISALAMLVIVELLALVFCCRLVAKTGAWTYARLRRPEPSVRAGDLTEC